MEEKVVSKFDMETVIHIMLIEEEQNRSVQEHLSEAVVCIQGLIVEF